MRLLLLRLPFQLDSNTVIHKTAFIVSIQCSFETYGYVNTILLLQQFFH